MKPKIYLLFILVFCNLASKAQTLNWSWAEQTIPYDTAAYCFAYGTAADNSGNVYVTGSFSKDSVKIGNVTLTNAGGYDFFIAKYDKDGNLSWVREAGGLGNEEGMGIAMDKAGYIYVTGYFGSDAIGFGSLPPLVNASSGHLDIFVAKYDSLGNAVWARNAGGMGDEKATGIATDAHSNLFVTGIYNDTFNFGSTTLYNGGDYDIFTAKYDSSGNVIWAHSAGGNQYDVPESVTADTAGNIYVVGEFYSDTMVFGGEISLYKLSGVYYQDAFVAMYGPAGNLMWAEREGGELNNFCKGICSDGAGNVIITGYYSSSFMNIGASMLDGPGTFTAKLSSSGSVVWATGAVGGQSNAVACGTNGNIYIAGSYADSLDFGGTVLENGAPPLADIFVGAYNSSGNFLWAKGAGGTNTDVALSVSTNSAGDVFTSGYFESTQITFNGTTLYGLGTNYYQMFIAKLSPLPTGIMALSQTEGVSVYPNPTSGLFYVTVDGLLQNNIINVFNCLGDKVYTEVFNGSLKALNLNLAPGVYYVQVLGDNNNSVTKIVRE